MTLDPLGTIGELGPREPIDDGAVLEDENLVGEPDDEVEILFDQE